MAESLPKYHGQQSIVMKALRTTWYLGIKTLHELQQLATGAKRKGLQLSIETVNCNHVEMNVGCTQTLHRGHTRSTQIDQVWIPQIHSQNYAQIMMGEN